MRVFPARCATPDQSAALCYIPEEGMPGSYAQWMYEWENRLTSVDNNRVVRPLAWGVECANEWPCRNGVPPGQMPADPEKFFAEYNQRIIANSDEFYSYCVPSDFRTERREVKVFS